MSEPRGTTMTDISQPLAGRVALVTGASRGIGAACARALLAAGAQVTIAARDQRALSTLAEGLDAGARVLAVAADVTDAGALLRLVTATVERFGRLDAAVNNAGTSHRPTPIADIDPDQFDKVVATDLRGVYLSMRAEIPALLEAGGGTIVNIASTAGIKGVPGMSAYAAAKAGVIALTRAAALDYSTKRIRVNAIAPGSILAGPILNAPPQALDQAGAMAPMRRMGRPEEIAAAAVWLSSSQSSFVTGTTLAVDGGYTAR
jgi:NAD(P)-dependent dehydrogenase (short-subunit alcohol dehydrogenase family)